MKIEHDQHHGKTKWQEMCDNDARIWIHEQLFLAGQRHTHSLAKKEIAKKEIHQHFGCLSPCSPKDLSERNIPPRNLLA
jgi:hypothetical protein